MNLTFLHQRRTQTRVGHYLLHEFARVIRAHCRETDLMARLGGEAFVILMPEVGASGVAGFVTEEREGSLLRRADKRCTAARRPGAIAW